jgi:hypothetical protein
MGRRLAASFDSRQAMASATIDDVYVDELNAKKQRVWRG